MILRLSLDLPDDKSYIRTSRILSRTLLEEIQVVKGDIDDVEFIVGELCGNVVRHAQLAAAHYQVVLEYYKPRVVIIVTDNGQGFAGKDTPPIGTIRPDFEGRQRLGGFGLPLLEGLSDKFDITKTDPHGTTVRIEKNLHYDTVAAADEAAARDESGSEYDATSDGDALPS